MKKSEAVILLILMLLLNGCSNKEQVQDNLSLGITSLENSSYDEALAYFEEAVENKTDLKDAYRGMGISYLGLNNYSMAIEAFENALKESNGRIDKEVVDITYYLASAYLKNDNPSKAISIYSNLLAYKKDDFTSYLRGIAYLITGKLEPAKKNFSFAAENNKKDFDLFIEIYQNMSEYGYKEEGMLYLDQALENAKEMNTETADYWYQAGRLKYYHESYEEAGALLEKANEAGVLEASLYLGMTYEAMGDYNYATTLYNSYLENDETKAQVYNQLGICQMKLNNYEKALEAFEAGIALDDKVYIKRLKFNEIAAYEYLGNFEKARLLMEEYLTLYPGDDEASREYEFLKTR